MRLLRTGWPGKTFIKISYQALKFPTTTILLSYWELAFIFLPFLRFKCVDVSSSIFLFANIAIAISNLNTMAPLWKSQSTELKRRTSKACIFPVAIYGCEAWTISKSDEKKITSFEIQCYRKILRISWTERKTNASVLEQLGVKAPQLLNLIKKQKLSYFGHFKRHNTLGQRETQKEMDAGHWQMDGSLDCGGWKTST